MSRIELPASDELDRLKLISQEYAPHTERASWIALGRVAHTLELDDVCLPAARSRNSETALEHAHD